MGAFLTTNMSTEASSPQPPEQVAAEPLDKEEQAAEAKLVVFGGNGFVGSRVCEVAHGMGLHVVSINRSGRPAWLKQAWADEVEWIHGDALQPSSYIDQLTGALGAVSCVGGFGSNATMYRVCGEANIRAIETAASVHVPRFVFISVYHDTIPGFVKSVGYFRGKIDAEAALRRCYPGGGGVSVQPFFIHGTRQLNERVSIPLQVVGIPLERALSFLPNTKQLSTSIPIIGTSFIPPVGVSSVARAAVTAATDPAITADVLDVWDIARF